MAKKLTWMVLEVDLDCSDCYKDVKKILAKFPEIRDQTFQMQKNEVRVTVDCCSPERIRNKLFSKGGKVIKSIHIIEQPNPPKPPENPTAAPKKPTTSSAPATATQTPTAGARTKKAQELAPVSAIPPGREPALGVPVGGKYYHFPSGFSCPQCGYPCYHGYRRQPTIYDNFSGDTGATYR